MNRDQPIEDNLFYHVYNRGNDRERIFGDKSDYHAFLQKMKSLAVRYSIAVPIYTLMPNHYHLIVLQNPGGNLSKMMGALATSAAKRYNLKYGHIGHLFQGPFRYKPIGDDALWYVGCYIHLNPVRARLVKRPEEWPYSNFAEIAEAEVEGFLPHGKNRDEGNLLQGYPEFVHNILSDEKIEKEIWAKVKPYLPEPQMKVTFSPDKTT